MQIFLDDVLDNPDAVDYAIPIAESELKNMTTMIRDWNEAAADLPGLLNAFTRPVFAESNDLLAEAVMMQSQLENLKTSPEDTTAQAIVYRFSMLLAKYRPVKSVMNMLLLNQPAEPYHRGEASRTKKL